MTETEIRDATSATPKYDDPYAETPTRLRSLSVVEATPNDADAEPTVLSPSLTECVASETNDQDSPSRISESPGAVVPELNGEASHADSESAADAVLSCSQSETDSSGTYDEPWDLRAARLGIESRLKVAQGSRSKATRQDVRYRTMDPRPAMEYDEPWDRRARDVQRTLISAKNAKEEARVFLEGYAGASHLPVFRGSTCRRPDAARYVDQPSSKKGMAT